MRRSKLEKCFEEYIIEYKSSIYRLAYSYVRNKEDSLDIVQESIYKGFESIDKIKEPKFIKTWFYRIVVNTSIDFIRKRQREVLVDEEFLQINDTGHRDSYTNIDLQRALDALPDEYRIIIILRYFEDLKIKEVAKILNQNINTIKTKLYKGLDMLKIDIDIDDQEELR